MAWSLEELTDALIVSMVDNSRYPILAGQPMPASMRNEMEDSMGRLALPIYQFLESYVLDPVLEASYLVKTHVDDPLAGYLADKIDNQTILYNASTFELYVGEVPVATDVLTGGVRIGAQPYLYMSGANLMLNAETDPLLVGGNNMVPTSRAVKLYVDAALIAGGSGGDMFKSTYDTGDNGVVDDSERLDNQLPSYYLDWANFTGTPTTIAGYGITNAYTQAEIDAFFEGEDTGKKQVHWDRITNKPAITSIPDPGNNRVLTSDGTATGIVAEPSLLFDGSVLYVDTINEVTTDAGVTVEGIFMRDDQIGTTSSYEGNFFFTNSYQRQETSPLYLQRKGYGGSTAYVHDLNYKYSGTIALPTAAATNATIRAIRAYAYDGTTDREVAKTSWGIDGAVATDNIAGLIGWQIRPSGVAASLATIMTLNEDGLHIDNINEHTATAGVTINNDTVILGSADIEDDVTIDNATGLENKYIYLYGRTINTSGPRLQLTKGRAAAYAASGDTLGDIYWIGFPTTGLQAGARLTATTTEAHSYNNRGTDVSLYTCANTTNTLVERLKVAESGAIYMYSLGSDDTEDHVIAIDDATGLLSKRSVTSIGGVSFGTSQWQIPYTNSTLDDFDYSTGFYYNGSQLQMQYQLRIAASTGGLAWTLTNSSGDFTIAGPNTSTSAQYDLVITGATSANVSGSDASSATFKGGNQTGTGGGDGGDALIYGGSSVSGSRGQIYFGDGTFGTLQNDEAETNLVAYDTATGLLTYRSVTSIGGTSVSFGSAGEVPYTNATTDDFNYTTNFNFDGTDLNLPNALNVDTIDEFTVSAGVTIEGLKIEDADIGSSTGLGGTFFFTSWDLYDESSDLVTNVRIYSNTAAEGHEEYTNRLGGTIAVPATVPTDAVLKWSRYLAFDATAMREVARHTVKVDGTVATDNIAGEFLWEVRPSGVSAGLTVDMTFDQDGLHIENLITSATDMTFEDATTGPHSLSDLILGAGMTFENGLTYSAGTVTLGGDLTAATTITNATSGTYSFSLGTSGNYLSDFAINATGISIMSRNNSNISLWTGSGYIQLQANTRFNSGNILGTGVTATNTYHLAAYDTDGASYTNFITFTAGTTPTMTFPQSGGGTTNFLRADGAWAAPTGGASTFTALTDTPSDYTGGVGGDFVMVNAGATALEFVDPGSITINSFNGTLDGSLSIDGTNTNSLQIRHAHATVGSSIIEFYTASEVGMVAYTGTNWTGFYSSFYVGQQYASMTVEFTVADLKQILINATAMLVTDAEDSTGLQYAADYSTAGISVGARWIPDWGTVGDYIAGIVINTASGGPGAPTATEDGYVLYYDHSNTRYDLKADTGGTNHALLSATHSDTLTASVVRGDVIIGNSTPAWSRLAISGTSNHVFRTNGTDPYWGALNYTDLAGSLPTHASTHITGGGDTIANFSTTTTTAGLVPGSNNVGVTYFLNANGAWSVPTGSGISFGTTTQVPYTNATGDDFLYNANFTYNGTQLAATTIGNTNLSTTYVGIGTASSSTYGLFSTHASNPGWFVRNLGSTGSNTAWASMSLELQVTGTPTFTQGAFFYFKYRNATTVYNVGAFGVMAAGGTGTEGILQFYSYYGSQRRLRMSVGADDAAGTYLELHSVTSAGDVEIRFQQATTDRAVIGWDDSADGATGGINLEVGASGLTTTPAIFIGNENHVCIGGQTDSSANELMVLGADVNVRFESTTGNASLELAGNDTGDDVSIEFIQDTTVQAIIGWDDSADSNTGGLNIEQNTVFSTTPAIFIGNNNHVAMGTQLDSSAYALYVYEGAADCHVVIKGAGTGNNAELSIAPDGTGDDAQITFGTSSTGYIKHDGTLTYLDMTPNSTTLALRMDGSGWLFAPNLHNITNSNNVLYNSTSGEITWLSSSDIRLKKNIKEWQPDSLTFFMSQRLIKFDRRDGSTMDEIGWDGTMMRELMPDMTWLDKDGYVNIKDAHFQFHFHRAIQQLGEKVQGLETLEQRVDRLERENIDLRKQLLNLKNHG